MILTPDNEYSAVFDTCVLAPMPLCDILLRCAEEPALYRAYWSEETLVELRRILLRFGLTDEQANRRIRMMQEAFPEARICVPMELLAAIPTLPDPFDRHVVAAAILAKADVIVTSNLKDFPKEVLDPYHLLVHSPDEFLLHQYHLNPSILLDKLDNQASAIGETRTKIIERLQNAAPLFVKAVKEQQSF
jgi:predicted nucleic acid-binding protein